MDGGSTASYVYNALNQRVSETVGGTTTQFAYNVAGQRVSIWNTASPAGQLVEQYYVGNKRVAYFANNMLHFQHQDWTGTERMRTTFNGAVEGTFTSMSFGDAFATVSGSDGDPYHYAVLDHDYSSDTDHAQFRQYSSTPGRWMSPDPYDGSYNQFNPQSMNRYTYALNNPVRFVDPSGLSCVALIVANDDGSVTVVYADDGDGQGCAAGGVAPDGTTTEYDVNVGAGDDGGVDTGDAGDDGGIDGFGFGFGFGFGAGSGFGSVGGAGVATSNPTILHCAGQALGNGNGISLVLDAASLLPGEGAVAVGLKVGVGIISAGNSLYNNQPGSAALSATGTLLYEVGALNKAAGSLGFTALQATPVLGTIFGAIATANDLINTGRVFAGCLSQ